MSTFLFDFIQKLGARNIGPSIRSISLKLYQAGVKLGGSDMAYETILPDSSRIKVNEVLPKVHNAKLIGQGTSLIGDINIDEGCTIQFNNLIQAGPGGKINIGKNTIINDLVIIKADHNNIVSIGENVLIASNVYLRNCTINNNAVIGIGAKVYDGSFVEGILGAGGVLLEGEKIPEGEIWAGNPAVFIRKITEDERDHNKDLIFQYSKVADVINEEMMKSIEDQLDLEEIRKRPLDREFCMDEHRRLELARTEGLPYATEDFINAKRIMDMEYMADLETHNANKQMIKDYPYNYDEFPKNFNTHKSNYKIHNELKEKVDTDKEMQAPNYQVFDEQNDVAKPDNWTRKY